MCAVGVAFIAWRNYNVDYLAKDLGNVRNVKTIEMDGRHDKDYLELQVFKRSFSSSK